MSVLPVSVKGIRNRNDYHSIATLDPTVSSMKRNKMVQDCYVEHVEKDNFKYNTMKDKENATKNKFRMKR